MDIKTIVVTVAVTLVLEYLARFTLPKIVYLLKRNPSKEINVAYDDLVKAIDKFENAFRKLESRKKHVDIEAFTIGTQMDQIKSDKDRLLQRLSNLGK